MISSWYAWVDYPLDALKVIAKKNNSSFTTVLLTRDELERLDRETLINLIEQRLELCAEQVKPPDLAVFVEEYEEIMAAQELMEK